ncbi:MAG: hypothetical protein P9M11_06765 [Candidatus Tenebribacter burtonii]|jgi:predicted peroxiredoxin|nr:hypothetical protein [Candidatus Tenebribacter burtonii]
MNIGIIISSNDAETCRIALQHAIFHLMQNDEVKVFFVDSGREYFQANSTKFNVSEEAEKFKQAGGLIYICDSKKKLEEYLKKYFVPLISNKTAVDISTNDEFRSIKFENIYIRNFM